MEITKVIAVLHRLGCESIKNGGGGWVNASCPFAQWLHAKGTDSHPSFGVTTEADDQSSWKCLGCGRKGDLSSLVWRYLRLSKKDPRSFADVFHLIANHDIPKYDAEAFKVVNAMKSSTYWGNPTVGVGGVKVEVGAIPLQLVMQVAKGEEEVLPPEDSLNTYTPDFPPDIFKWLTDPKPSVDSDVENPPRGLSPQTVKELGLLWNPDKAKVVIPIRDASGKLVAVTQRATQKWQKPKFLHSTGFKRDRYLYGEAFLRKKGGTVVLVEGHFDVMHLWELGYSALAVMGSHLSWLQAEKLRQWFGRVVILRDGDAAGTESCVIWKQTLEKFVVVDVPAVQDEWDPDDYSAYDLQTLIGPP